MFKKMLILAAFVPALFIGCSEDNSLSEADVRTIIQEEAKADSNNTEKQVDTVYVVTHDTVVSVVSQRDTVVSIINNNTTDSIIVSKVDTVYIAQSSSSSQEDSLNFSSGEIVRQEWLSYPYSFFAGQRSTDSVLHKYPSSNVIEYWYVNTNVEFNAETDSLIKDYGEGFDTTYTTSSITYIYHYVGMYFKAVRRDTCISEYSRASGATKLTIKFAKQPSLSPYYHYHVTDSTDADTNIRTATYKYYGGTAVFIYLADGSSYAGAMYYDDGHTTSLSEAPTSGNASSTQVSETIRKRCLAGM